MARATVILIHGYKGHPDSPWKLWLRDQLVQSDIEVLLPTMPDADHPKLQEWLATVNGLVGQAAEPVILVGHSLGGTTVLRYLEQPDALPIKAGVLLAGATSAAIHRQRHPGIMDFFAQSWNFDAIRSKRTPLIAIYSADDPAVEVLEGELVRDELGARWVLLDKSYQHFSTSSGVLEIPELRKEILQLV